MPRIPTYAYSEAPPQAPAFGGGGGDNPFSGIVGTITALGMRLKNLDERKQQADDTITATKAVADLSVDLQGSIDEIYKDPSLSDMEKQKKSTELIMSKRSDYQSATSGIKSPGAMQIGFDRLTDVQMAAARDVRVRTAKMIEEKSGAVKDFQTGQVMEAAGTTPLDENAGLSPVVWAKIKIYNDTLLGLGMPKELVKVYGDSLVRQARVASAGYTIFRNPSMRDEILDKAGLNMKERLDALNTSNSMMDQERKQRDELKRLKVDELGKQLLGVQDEEDRGLVPKGTTEETANGFIKLHPEIAHDQASVDSVYSHTGPPTLSTMQVADMASRFMDGESVDTSILGPVQRFSFKKLVMDTSRDELETEVKPYIQGMDSKSQADFVSAWLTKRRQGLTAREASIQSFNITSPSAIRQNAQLASFIESEVSRRTGNAFPSLSDVQPLLREPVAGEPFQNEYTKQLYMDESAISLRYNTAILLLEDNSRISKDEKLEVKAQLDKWRDASMVTASEKHKAAALADPKNKDKSAVMAFSQGLPGALAARRLTRKQADALAPVDFIADMSKAFGLDEYMAADLERRSRYLIEMRGGVQTLTEEDRRVLAADVKRRSAEWR